MSSEIEKVAKQLEKKQISEIEKTAQEIEKACNNFFKFIEELLNKGKELDTKSTDKMEKISNVFKDFYSRSEAIEEAWRLNERQFREGRIEKDWAPLHSGILDGQTLCLRDGDVGDDPGAPDPRRDGLQQGTARRTLFPRRQDHRDL